MILLVLVVVLWIIVLTPSALRRLAERQGAGSIDHFHHQLQLLEHAGPKLVTPAYRLHAAVGGGERGGTFTSVDAAGPRPKLVLLRPTDDERSADIDGVDGAHYERVGVFETPEPPTSPAQTWAELRAYRRQQARQRCTMVLRCLTTGAISTGLLGMLPALHLAWIFTALTGIAALGLVGLIAYAGEVEGQRQERPLNRVDQGLEADPFYGAAEAGYPGAWDEEDGAAPRRAAAGH